MGMYDVQKWSKVIGFFYSSEKFIIEILVPWSNEIDSDVSFGFLVPQDQQFLFVDSDLIIHYQLPNSVLKYH